MITEKEKGWLTIMRLNELIPRQEIKKGIRIGRYEAEFEWRSKKNLWGRFGGGWNWHIGVQWSSSSMIVYCLVFMLSFRLKKKPDGQEKGS